MNKVDILKLEKITVQNFFTIFAQFCAKSVQNATLMPTKAER